MISFFSPISSDFAHPLEKCAFLRGCTHFFNFGQKAYTIRHFDEKIEVMEKEGEKPSWIAILWRVAAIATVIIPVLILLGAWIYRALNDLHIVENRFEQLPNDILRKIFTMAGATILNLESTSKANQELIEAKVQVEKNGETTLCESPLKNSLNDYHILINLANELSHIMKGEHVAPHEREMILISTSLLLRELNQEKALEIARNIEEGAPFKPFLLAVIADSFAITNPLKAKEVASEALTVAKQDPSKIAKIVEVFLKIDLIKAEEIAKNMFEGLHKIKALASVSKAWALSDANKAMEILDHAAPILEKEIGYRGLTAFIEPLALINREKGLEYAERAIQRTLTLKSDQEKFCDLVAIAHVLFLFDSKKAEEILWFALSLDISLCFFNDNFVSNYRRIAILNSLGPQSLAKVIDLLVREVNSYFNYHSRSSNLANIAANLSNREKAKEVIEMAIDALDSIDAGFNKVKQMALNTIYKTLVEFGINPSKTAEIKEQALAHLDKLDDDRFRIESLAILDHQKALEEANSIENPNKKAAALLSIFRTLNEKYFLPPTWLHGQ